MEADSISGLGYVYQQMGEYMTALRYHENDLEIAEQLEIASLQCRACGNIGKKAVNSRIVLLSCDLDF